MAKQKNKKILLIAVVAFLVSIAAVGVLEKTGAIDLFKPDSTNGPTSNEQAAEAKANADSKQKFIEGTDGEGRNHNTTSTQTTSIELRASKESDGTVTVFTKLPGLSAGTCTLKVTNGNTQKEYTASVIYQAEYSICAGYSVPVAEIGNGNWSLNLSVNSDGQTQTKTITYEVR